MNGPSEELKQRVRENQNKLKKLIYQLTSDTNIIDSDKDSTVELVENMINQRVIKELENIKSKLNIINFYDITDKRIKELKLAEEVDNRSLLEREHPDFPINRKELKQK